MLASTNRQDILDQVHNTIIKTRVKINLISSYVKISMTLYVPSRLPSFKIVEPT